MLGTNIEDLQDEMKSELLRFPPFPAIVSFDFHNAKELGERRRVKDKDIKFEVVFAL